MELISHHQPEELGKGQKETHRSTKQDREPEIVTQIGPNDFW